MRRELILSVVLGLVVIASGVDLVMDFSEGVAFRHTLQEGLVFLVAIVALGWILIEMHRQRLEINALQVQLSASSSNQPKDPELRRARRELAGVIARQFDDWQLSQSEKEVGMLLLKGLSHKEIAMVRKTAEKTVRQQASAIYQKASLPGRHAFAAWFIEDFL